MNIKINDTDVRKLNSAVEYLFEQEFFSSAVSRLKEELARSSETFVWASVDLGSIPVELPTNI